MIESVNFAVIALALAVVFIYLILPRSSAASCSPGDHGFVCRCPWSA